LMDSQYKVGEPYTTDLGGCARCEGDGHPGIVFTPLTHFISFEDGFVATHWAPCPTNGQPILIGDGEFKGQPVRPAAWRLLELLEGEPSSLVPEHILEAAVALRRAFDDFQEVS
jgi:hypothetical protein